MTRCAPVLETPIKTCPGRQERRCVLRPRSAYSDVLRSDPRRAPCPCLLAAFSKSGFIAIVLWCLPVLAAPRPRGPKQDRIQTINLFEEGLSALQRNDHAACISNLERAQELEPQSDNIYYLGRCHDELGNYKKASFYYLQYMREASRTAETKPRLDKITQRLRILEEQDTKDRRRLLLGSGGAMSAIGLTGLLTAAGFYSGFLATRDIYSQTTDESSKRAARDTAVRFEQRAAGSLAAGLVGATVGAILIGVGLRTRYHLRPVTTAAGFMYPLPEGGAALCLQGELQ